MTTSMTNEVAFEALLEDIKRASNDVQRDAGTRFETLIKDWLTQEETYRDLFAKVETFKEWAASHPDLSNNGKDIGIDLVATLAENPQCFAAIQCKFYEKDAIVPKSGVDSFIAASNRGHFVQRYIIATNERWSENALAEMQRVTPPITLITRSLLASSQIDWATYLKTGQVVQQKKRTPRKYQDEAIQNVLTGFQDHNRGKLIMACGTGKTFTSMKIAERMEGNNGFVMFLVPSLALLSQTLTDWKRQCSVPIHAFAVCSDTTTGKPDLANIDELTSASDLCYPATTKADKLAEEIKRARTEPGMTVIFSTYQSIEVVSEAQHKFGMDEIGLIICDEAHRTAGGHYQDESDAPFQRIHSDEFIKGRKRLYMTATPRIYGEVVKEQKEKGEVILYSMDDEEIYGPTFHTITFSQAVGLGSLVDYKVIVLSVEEDILQSRAMSDYELVQNGGLSVKNAAKVVGCWRALSKIDLQGEVSMSDDRQPMRRAVGFAQIIEPNMKYLDRTSSKRFTDNFEITIEEFKDQQYKKLSENNKSLSREAYDLQYPIKCQTRHIDGSMNSTEKDALLNWLREDPEDNVCKILFNVRCLSEGVDVPALDAVLFLSPRKSQVEVVQTVGRVMRVSPQTGKKRGYVIIPIVTPAGLDPSVALNNNADFDVVWQVLNALKSIDTEFGAIVDGQRNVIDSSKIEVVCITNKKINRKTKTKDPKKISPKSRKKAQTLPEQGVLDFNHDEILEQEIRARIVKRVGNRREWGDWAEDVGKICQMQIKHINDVLSDPTKTKSRAAFESFKKELKATLNGNLTDDEVIEMLGQHVVTQPILDALFTVKNGDEIIYEFSKQNPIATAMTAMMNSLDKESMKSATKSLEDFYRSVRNRTRTIKTAADRQLLIKELFEKFFKAAFPKQQEKLGIVYTPIEIVDFINRSVADLLKKEFNCNVGDKGIHVLDPFSGTGTFIARLMQSGLIPKEQLPYKFDHELHANEIVPLAYYVASMNIEGVFHELCPNEVYRPNRVMIWTDTFANNRQSNIFSTTLGENNARLAELNRQDIRVIVGNPPYSVGQESQNDDNQNEHYDELDARLTETYVARTDSTLKGKLYDSYIRAYRWASDRIVRKGIIGFVTNAGWLETSSADGMRKCMTEEFNSIYVYHLKGNQRTSGERSRKEGGKVFGEGSRAPVAIVFLVKNPDSSEHGKIYFHTVDDYLTREEKLDVLKKDRSISYTPMNVIVPDDHGDWFNQRDDSISKYISMGGRNTSDKYIFKKPIVGVCTNRDTWIYGSSIRQIERNINRTTEAYSMAKNIYKASAKIKLDERVTEAREAVGNNISWTAGILKKLQQEKNINSFSSTKLRTSIYRPFFKQFLYYDRDALVERPGKWALAFPENTTENLVICSSGVGSKEYSCLMVNRIPCLDFLEKTQCFPRWLPGEQTGKKDTLDFGDSDEMPSGFTKEALPHFQAAYPREAMTEDDLFYYIYGILHSEDYRTRYANNLMKELPRIPRVATYEQFMAFAEAGRKLADLHVNFENVPPYAGVKIEYTKEGVPSYRVTEMKWAKIKGKTGNAAKDKSTLIYNDWITVKNVPLEAQEYVVNKKSALDWVVERACVSIDKASKIVNDFNDYAAEQGNERYPLELFLKVITVSLETLKIVRSLPPLEIHRLDVTE